MFRMWISNCVFTFGHILPTRWFVNLECDEKIATRIQRETGELNAFPSGVRLHRKASASLKILHWSHSEFFSFLAFFSHLGFFTSFQRPDFGQTARSTYLNSIAQNLLAFLQNSANLNQFPFQENRFGFWGDLLVQASSVWVCYGERFWIAHHTQCAYYKPNAARLCESRLLLSLPGYSNRVCLKYRRMQTIKNSYLGFGNHCRSWVCNQDAAPPWQSGWSSREALDAPALRHSGRTAACNRSNYIYSYKQIYVKKFFLLAKFWLLRVSSPAWPPVHRSG